MKKKGQMIWIIIAQMILIITLIIVIISRIPPSTIIPVEETNQNLNRNLNLYFNKEIDYPFSIVDLYNNNVVSRTDTLSNGQVKYYILDAYLIKGLKSNVKQSILNMNILEIMREKH
jgi:hypothetical protein